MILGRLDRIYIISLSPGSDEVIGKFRSRLTAFKLFVDVPFEVVPAVNGGRINKQFLRDSNLSLYDSWAIESSNSWWNRPMKAGEIGCSLSHLKVWEMAYKAGHGRIAILEEDFLPVQFDLPEVADVVADWELFYLGRIAQERDQQFLGCQVVIPGFSYQSHAYLLSRTGIEKLNFSGFRNWLFPVDEFLPALYCRHPREDIRNLVNFSLTTYAFDQNLIVQDKQHISMTETTKLANDLSYTPIYPDLYDAFGVNTDTWVKKYVNAQLVDREFDLICDEPIDNVYTFPVFTPLFCSQLIEEAENHGEWETARHQRYPTNDKLLSKFGLDVVYNFVIMNYVMPLVLHKYTLEDYWMNVDIENFIARYSGDVQQHLGVHHDGTHLSFILTLNTEYLGGGTYFPKFKTLVKPNQAGVMSVHPGMVGYLHGARPVLEGKRYVVASFLKGKAS